MVLIPTKRKIRIFKTVFINLQGNVVVRTPPPLTRGHFEGFFPHRKCAVSAFGYSGFSVRLNWIDIDGAEEDFPGPGSSGAEGARQSRRQRHLHRGGRGAGPQRPAL